MFRCFRIFRRGATFWGKLGGVSPYSGGDHRIFRESKKNEGGGVGGGGVKILSLW
jgi:hypothetical protein